MNQKTEYALGSFLAVRDRSRSELERYLLHKQVDPEEIKTILDRFTEVELVNDERFIASVIHSYLNKGKGQLFIKQKLSQAGIEAKTIATAISEISKTELMQAMIKRLAKAERKLGLFTGQEYRQHAVKLLCSAGFLSQDALRFIDDTLEKV